MGGLGNQVKCEDIDYMRNPNNVAAVILGGGFGICPFPLTEIRAKPAVPIGGSYLLIDMPLSNCPNKVYILTQFNSASLNRHLTHTYNIMHSFLTITGKTLVPIDPSLRQIWRLWTIKPRFNFYDEEKPVYLSRRNLPPSMINSSKVF
ncbi:glucose-1-phosphate adenylyltransferase large subunit 1 [Carex littledalei]|uniref:glucose-1-phosphate adenylyltransferase n=1 Tax=Carex littledalei TaxID=544730 RepID=A0A833QPJ3_9POAL|nr:glucose-1-phosphate adenylyltransferase large subunit 1 [Carex littledalei]